MLASVPWTRPVLNTITQSEYPQAIRVHKSEPCAHLLQVSELLALLKKKNHTHPNENDICHV